MKEELVRNLYMRIVWDFSFDDDVARTYGRKVHDFDPSMKTNDFSRNHQVWFYRVGLADRMSHFYEKIKFPTQKYIIEQLHHQEVGNCII